MMLPPEYFEGLETHGTPWDHEVDDLHGYAEIEAVNPSIRNNSEWVWGDQFVVGKSPFTDEFYYQPYRALLNGTIVEGRSEAGKSSRVFDPWGAQCLANPAIRKVIFITYKESLTSFANFVIESARARRRFRWITTVPGKHTFGMPLIHTIHQRMPTTMRFATALIDALNMNFGRGYGVTYFYDVKRHAVVVVAGSQQLTLTDLTFGGLARLIANFEPPKGMDDEFRKSRTELLVSLFTLAEFDAINCVPGDDRAMIDVGKFFLSDALESLYVEAVVEQNPTVGVLLPQMIFSIGAEALSTLPDTSEIRVAVFVDEASVFFSENSSTMIQRLRSKGVAFVFLYQHRGQFEQNGRDFTKDFEGYASNKIYLSVENKDRAEFYRYMAGEQLKVTGASYRTAHRSDAFDGDTAPVMHLPDEYYPLTTVDNVAVRNVVAEAINLSVGPRPRLSVNDVFSLFSRPGYGLIRSSMDRDLWQQSGQMIPANFPFHVTPSEYTRRRSLPWPSPPGTKPAAYIDAYAAFIAATKGNEPTIAQGSGWKKILDQKQRRPKGQP